MISVADPVLYKVALRELRAHKRLVGRTHRGRFIQVFLGLKFYQNELPSIFSGQYVSTEVLQTLLDDLYAKSSRRADDCVLVLFDGTYHARTGLVAPGHAGPQNTWRNNFNLQKGVGCYAPIGDLQSPAFLQQERADCRHLAPIRNGALAGAACRLCPRGARYRNESHPKWLKIEPAGNGYAVVDVMNVGNFVGYVAPGNRRVPILPLIVALYHDATPGLVTATRQSLDLADFVSDFNFSGGEFAAYFDDARDNPHNLAILRADTSVTYVSPAAAQPARLPRVGRRPRRRHPPAPIPEPVLTGTPVPPPAANTGWEAEQCVAAVLRDAGWHVYDLTRQRIGYDLMATRGRETRYVDVKSSLSYCSPSLTAREWQQAKSHGLRYVLAVLENFNPLGQNVVYWVPGPTRTCLCRAATSVAYCLARSSWQRATTVLDRI